MSLVLACFSSCLLRLVPLLELSPEVLPLLLLLLDKISLALRHALIQEVFESEQFIEDLKVLVDLRLDGSAVVSDGPESSLSIILFFLDGFQFLSCDVGFLLDLCEEIEEAFGVGLKHLFSTHKSLRPGGVVQSQVLDFLELGFVELLSQEYLPFLFFELVTGLLVLRPLDRHCETVELVHVHFRSYFRTDRDARRLDVCLAQLPQTAFSHWPVLLPQL